MKQTHLDLFSGIGGFALAARWAGLQTIQFVEIDPYSQKVLKKNFPEIPIHDDIQTYNATQLCGPFLLTGGYPCQPFSTAGQRRGKEDDRHLWPEMLRIIGECRPTWVCAENVAGHINLGLDEVLADLESEDYATRTFIIPACAKDAPHRRDRVWIVAYSESDRVFPTTQKHFRNRPGENEKERQAQSCNSSPSSADVADSNSTGLEKWEGGTTPQDCRHQQHRGEECREWPTESGICRISNGVPNRVDRLKGLGNAIVPQIAYEIITAIVSAGLTAPGHHAPRSA